MKEPLRNDGDNQPRYPQPERAEAQGQEETWIFNQGVIDPDGKVQLLQLFFRQVACLHFFHNYGPSIGHPENHCREPEKSYLLVESHNFQQGIERFDQGVDEIKGLQNFQGSKNAHDNNEYLETEAERGQSPFLQCGDKRLRCFIGCFRGSEDGRGDIEKGCNGNHRENSGGKTEESSLCGMNPRFCLDYSFLNEVMGDEKKNGHECHLVPGEREHRHGGNAGVYIGEHTDKEGQGGHCRKAEQAHHGLKEKINPCQESAPCQACREK